LQALGHGCRVRIFDGIDDRLCASLPTEGNNDVTRRCGKHFEARHGTNSGIRQRLLWQLAARDLDRLEQRRQPITVGGVIGQLRRHDDLVLGIDCRMFVVALLEVPPACFMMWLSASVKLS